MDFIRGAVYKVYLAFYTRLHSYKLDRARNLFLRLHYYYYLSTRTILHLSSSIIIITLILVLKPLSFCLLLPINLGLCSLRASPHESRSIYIINTRKQPVNTTTFPPSRSTVLFLRVIKVNVRWEILLHLVSFGNNARRRILRSSSRHLNSPFHNDVVSTTTIIDPRSHRHECRWWQTAKEIMVHAAITRHIGCHC